VSGPGELDTSSRASQVVGSVSLPLPVVSEMEVATRCAGMYPGCLLASSVPGTVRCVTVEGLRTRC
jgi:hypothetical protein